MSQPLHPPCPLPPIPHLIITVGIPASGKTSWAKQYMIDTPRVMNSNRDDIREWFFTNHNIHDYRYTGKREKMVTLYQHTEIRGWLREDLNVIVSDTNLNNATQASLEVIAAQEGATVEYKVFDTPFHLCRERNRTRYATVPDSVMINMETKMRDYLGKYVKPKNGHWGKCRCIVVDIDGTLALHPTRSPHDLTRVIEDTARYWVIDHVNEWGKLPGDTVIVLSGREDVCREDTEKWLDTHGVNYDHLYMRAAEDRRNDSIIKEELFLAHIAGQYNVSHVVDDRAQVTTMWETLGLDIMNVGGHRSDF